MGYKSLYMYKIKILMEAEKTPSSALVVELQRTIYSYIYVVH
jgi:hypothetical protein